VAEMVDMLDASRGFENNVEVVNTARQLMLKTLEVIRS
jgi:flagellar basal-body rod protein FlgC